MMEHNYNRCCFQLHLLDQAALHVLLLLLLCLLVSNGTATHCH